MKSLTTSLFLAQIGFEQFKVKATMSGVHNQNLLYALSDSHLNLDTFVVSKDKEIDEDSDDDDDDEDNVSDHELAEEDADIKIESASNSTNKGSPTKMRGSNERRPKEHQLIGRDENGLFKDHQSFLKMRNRINKQEDGHQDMFDKINDKL
tara:strand:+ start:109 stop:561 length:453 start_codon:yes stop_codon:yes gene_type:complete